MHFSRLGRTTKREDRGDLRSARREEREEGRQKIEENVEAAKPQLKLQ